MNFLLPHRFKRTGAIMVPLGITFWLAMQLGFVTKVLTYAFGEPGVPSPYHGINVAIAMISFLSFLAGLYFVSFSREKIEDEMVQRTRLDSFQFAALMQIILLICGFVCIVLFKDPGESGMLLFFIALVSIFWLSFVGRFNYILHIKLAN